MYPILTNTTYNSQVQKSLKIPKGTMPFAETYGTRTACPSGAHEQELLALLGHMNKNCLPFWGTYVHPRFLVGFVLFKLLVFWTQEGFRKKL
jgi:hypothetical protein